jgi:hypothetical protein
MRRAGLRIGVWALAGTIVTCFWVLFAMIAGPTHFDGHWAVIGITMPASLVLSSGPVTWQTAMLLNAAIYGAVGLATEPLIRLRRQWR